MNHIDELDNPAWHATKTCQPHLATGTERATKYFPDISPFAAIASEQDFAELSQLVPIDGVAGILSPVSQALPKETATWLEVAAISVHQMICADPMPTTPANPGQLLNESDFEQMYQLAVITDPGPFEVNTGKMGNYYGIYEGNQLIAMAGERLICPHWVEVSAVCVHPDHEGQGLAKKLMLQTMQGIAAANKGAFLHVRHGSPAEQRALGLYEKLGFTVHQQAVVQIFQRRA